MGSGTASVSCSKSNQTRAQEPVCVLQCFSFCLLAAVCHRLVFEKWWIKSIINLTLCIYVFYQHSTYKMQMQTFSMAFAILNWVECQTKMMSRPHCYNINWKQKRDLKCTNPGCTVIAVYSIQRNSLLAQNLRNSYNTQSVIFCLNTLCLAKNTWKYTY